MLPFLLPACTAPEAVAPDVLSTALTLDLEKREGQASIQFLSPPDAEFIRLETGDLEFSKILLDEEPVEFELQDGILSLPVTGERLSVAYHFRPHEGFRGWMPSRGLTFTWPYFCGNLFPCNPDPADGLLFSLELRGYDQALSAIYPSNIPSEAPPYMLGLALGDYTQIDLGSTTAGTRLSAWSLPGERDYILSGTQNLVAAFDFLERTYGPYSFGDHAGSVSVDWDDIGGMEHHPFWHVASNSIRSEEAHVHEAAHGWFGDGVRFACWEDFVLSEGTTTYITGRSLIAAGGPDIFGAYVEELDLICAPSSHSNTVAMPEGCGEIDILTDPLWSMVPYMKGACFYEDVADLIGVEPVDQVISSFYQEHVGQAATMAQMIDDLRERVEEEDLPAYDRLVQEWLLQLDCPSDYARRCGVHGN